MRYARSCQFIFAALVAVLTLAASAVCARGTDGVEGALPSADPDGYRAATFEADITIPVGHACMGGGIALRLAWVALFLSGGYFLGAHPWVQENFWIVIVAIIVISVIPVAVEIIRGWRESRREAKEDPVRS